MLSINLPCPVLSHQKVGNLRLASFPVSRRYIIFPPSTELRARRSGFHARMFPPKVSISFIILLNNGRPGTLADCFSTISAEIVIPSRTAYSRNSVSCASILKTCLSSTSVDLRAYKKNFLFSILFIIVIKNLFVLSKYYESKLLLISHLLRGEKILSPAEGGNTNSLANSLAKTGETAWACLRHAHSLVGSQPLSSILVPRTGLAPARDLTP